MTQRSPGCPAFPYHLLPSGEEYVDPSPRKRTDGTDEGAQRAFDSISPEELAAFMEEEIERRMAAHVALFTAKVRDDDNKRQGLLASSNTARRENGSQQKFTGGSEAAPLTMIVEKSLVQISGLGPEPKISTVSLSKVNITAPPLGSNHLLRARIRWGSGKAKNSVLIDYRNGLRVTVDGSSIEVSGVYDWVGSGPRFNVSGIGPDVFLGAQVIEGSIGTPNSQATLTLGGSPIGAGSSDAFIVPSFANRLTIAGTTAGPYDIQFSQDLAGEGLFAELLGVLPGQTVLIPGGTEAVLITNHNAASDNVLAVFGLDF